MAGKITTNALLLSMLISTWFTGSANAQNGSPPQEPTSATVNTNFPQREPFDISKASQLSFPGSFRLQVAATGLGKPRMMAVNNDGSIYITRRDKGDVLLLRDNNNDGRFEEKKTVLTGFEGVHGITIHNGYIYLCSNRILKRGKLGPKGEILKPQVLMSDLPDGGQHGNRTIYFGPDGKLYITVGSTCNDCYETNKENATILRATADGKTRRIYAKGLRNTIGIDWHPETKELWGADNATDWRGDDKPMEELNRITEGGDYGWPLVYEDRQVDMTREDPVGMTKEEYAKTTVPSVLSFPAHSAPINLIFLHKAKSFPGDYQDDALVTLHGSWNRKAPHGYKVVRVRFENGEPVEVEDFLSGFLKEDGKTYLGRPAGLAVSPEGTVYISDDANGVIYAVTGQELNLATEK